MYEIDSSLFTLKQSSFITKLPTWTTGFIQVTCSAWEGFFSCVAVTIATVMAGSLSLVRTSFIFTETFDPINNRLRMFYSPIMGAYAVFLELLIHLYRGKACPLIYTVCIHILCTDIKPTKSRSSRVICKWVGLFFCLWAAQLRIYAIKSPGSSSDKSVQRADWQEALNRLTFCLSIKPGLPIIAPVRQRQNNTRSDDSGYAEHRLEDDESVKRRWSLYERKPFPPPKMRQWITCNGVFFFLFFFFAEHLKNSLRQKAGVQRPGTQEIWNDPPSISCQTLSGCGKAWEWCEACDFQISDTLRERRK